MVAKFPGSTILFPLQVLNGPKCFNTYTKIYIINKGLIANLPNPLAPVAPLFLQAARTFASDAGASAIF